MISVASLRQLVASGMTAAQIVDVVEAELAADAGALEERRSRDRDRKARQRSRDRQSVPVTSRKSRDTHEQPIETLEDFKASVTDDVDELENSASLSLTSSFEDSLKGKKERVVVARARGGSASRDRGTRLPDGWSPKPEDFDFAVSTLGESGCKRELDKFRDWWPAQPGVKGRKVDWDLTWRTWVRKEADKRKSNGRNDDARTRILEEVFGRNDGGRGQALDGDNTGLLPGFARR